MEESDPRRRGLRQTRYRVLVASSRERLESNRGDLWDSGEIVSNRSCLVEYVGSPLRSEQECWWKVRVRDETGHPSAWSAPARWTMGLLKASDWRAKWIGSGDPVPAGQSAGLDPWLRKEFTLAQAPTRAVIYVASLGYHELYVNGKRVGDAVLEPAVSDYRKRARYLTYEIGPLLHKGKNAIGLWLGTSWSLYPEYRVPGRPHRPMVLGQATILLPHGEKTRIVTDATWRAHPSPNRLLGDWGASTFGGEEFDATRAEPGWCDPGFDDRAWKQASTFDLNLALSAETIEPNRISHELHAVSVEKRPDGAYRDGAYRVDMGVNFVGWVEVPVVGPPGKRIEFLFSERPNEEMTHNLHSAYVIGPTGHGLFRNRFNYASGRWVTIRGLADPPPLDKIKGWQIRSDYRRTAHFDCANPLLNRIYDTTLWTFENLSLGGYVVDCPQRERRGYGGDAHSTTQTALDNYAMGAFYTKWSQDWRDVQAPDGSLPNTAPTYSGGGGPAWAGFCIHLPWKIYRQYGDLRILKENFPTMQRWLTSMETHTVDGLLTRWGEDWFFLGDWLWPYDDRAGIPNSDLPETLFFNNCYWAYALETASQVAQAIGEDEAAKTYRLRAARLCAAIHTRFYRPETHDYANGRQQYLAIALIAKIPPMSEEKAVWKRLEEEIRVHRSGHIDAGITGGALLTRLLIEQNRADLLYAMATKDDYPSWGYFLKTGLTTIPESWDESNSLLHSSYLFIGAWFIEGLVGIRPGPEGGFQHFILRPLIDAKPSLEHVAASYDSPYGRIACGWTRRGDHLDLRATIPPNTEATLCLPALNLTSATESGVPLNRALGVNRVKSGSNELILALQPGKYAFSFRERSHSVNPTGARAGGQMARSAFHQ